MLDFIIKGGVVLWVIMALSLAALAIIIERILYFRSIRVDEDKLFQRVKASIEKGHYDEALSICDNNESPLSALIKVGIEYRTYPESAQKEILKDAAAQELPRLERNVSALGTIAHIAPLLGLLGTVTGTMKAFGVLGRFGSVADPSILAKGVSEALITTVGGIVVAVPAVIFYNYLVEKVNLMLLKIENQVTALVMMINAGKPRTTHEVRPAFDARKAFGNDRDAAAAEPQVPRGGFANGGGGSSGGNASGLSPSSGGTPGGSGAGTLPPGGSD